MTARELIDVIEKIACDTDEINLLNYTNKQVEQLDGALNEIVDLIEKFKEEEHDNKAAQG